MIPYFDAHCDTISRIARKDGRHLNEETDQWNLDMLSQCNPSAQFFAVFCDSANPGVGEKVLAQFSAFRRECERYSDRVVQCRTGAEIARAAEQHKLAAILSVEGAELLDCDLNKLEWAYQEGVRAVNLTWNHANILSGSHMEESARGLSRQGIRFVQRMNELGMIVDVSHLSDAGFWDVIESTSKPIMASHSNSRAQFFHTRNLTDSQFNAIIENQGIVGLNCYSAFLGTEPVTMDILRRHLDHFLDLGGEHTVALGGDWDGCSDLPEGFSGAWSWIDFYEYLLKHNYPEDLLRDLYFNNLMRTVSEVCTT